MVDTSGPVEFYDINTVKPWYIYNAYFYVPQRYVDLGIYCARILCARNPFTIEAMCVITGTRRRNGEGHLTWMMATVQTAIVRVW